MGDKIDSETKQNIESQVEKLRKATESEDREEIQREIDELMQISHKLAEEAYKKASAQQQQEGATSGDAHSHQDAAGSSKKPDDDVVDADFEELKQK
jgi:molecular chaperone DnaK